MAATVSIDVTCYKILLGVFMKHASNKQMVILDTLPLPDSICKHCGHVSSDIIERTYKPYGTPLCPRCGKPLDE